MGNCVIEQVLSLVLLPLFQYSSFYPHLNAKQDKMIHFVVLSWFVSNNCFLYCRTFSIQSLIKSNRECVNESLATRFLCSVLLYDDASISDDTLSNVMMTDE
jgi:hypothetical protein